MPDTATLICKTCGGNTEVDASATQHECQFCGATLIVQATLEARGAAEQAARQRLDQMEGQLSALVDRARQAAVAGDMAAAEALIRQKVEQEGQVYWETGYYRVMGLNTAEEVAKHHSWLISFELGQLPRPASASPGPGAPGGGAQPEIDPDSPYMKYMEAMAQQDLAGVLTNYPLVCQQKMATQPQWQGRPDADIRDAIAHALEDMVRNLPWASPEDLARHGYRVADAESQPDGTQAIRCGGCSAPLTVQDNQERITCEHCGTLTLVRLTGLQRYQAMGYTDVTQEQADNQQDAERWAIKKDVDALIRMTERMIDDEEAPAGSPRARELTFTYAVVTGDAALTPAMREELCQKLGLSAPRRCPTCEQEIALAADGSGRCPQCDSVINKPKPAKAPAAAAAEPPPPEESAPQKSWWQFWK